MHSVSVKRHNRIERNRKGWRRKEIKEQEGCRSPAHRPEREEGHPERVSRAWSRPAEPVSTSTWWSEGRFAPLHHLLPLFLLHTLVKGDRQQGLERGSGSALHPHLFRVTYLLAGLRTELSELAALFAGSSSLGAGLGGWNCMRGVCRRELPSFTCLRGSLFCAQPWLCQ